MNGKRQTANGGNNLAPAPRFFDLPLMRFSMMIKWPDRWLSLSCCVLLALGLAGEARGAGEADTRLRLEREFEQEGRAREDRLLQDAEALDGPLGQMEIDGQTYSVGDNVNDVGRALYISVQRQDWPGAARFLDAYLRFEDRDPMLVAYAEGGLARAAGDFDEAEARYRALLELQGDFLPGQLELARVLFEHRQDKEAQRAFEALRVRLKAQGEEAAGVLRTVEAFLGALRARRGSQGALALGPGYNNNLNQSSASRACLLAAPNGVCLLERTIPAPISAFGLNFESSAGLRRPLRGHHGLSLRAVAYGDVYPEQHRFSQVTLNMQAGYDHQTARNTLSLAPTFDAVLSGSDLFHTAIGVRAAWTHLFSDSAGATVEARWRDFTHRPAAFRFDDGLSAEVFLTGWHTWSNGWTLIGGADYSDKRAPDKPAAWHQAGLRLGVSKAFGERLDVFLLASVRYRNYGGFNALLGARRRDVTQNYTLILGRPAWRVAGLTPELRVDYTRAVSTVDWLYSYDRLAVSVRVKYEF